MTRLLSILLLTILLMLPTDSPLAAQPVDTLAAFIRQSSGQDTGMAVVVNDPTGQLTAALAKDVRLTVQGCTWDAKSVQAGRGALLTAGVAVRASLVCVEEKGLPYADNLINLLICASWGGRPVDPAELLRVLTPNGIGLIGNDANPAAIAGLGTKLKQAGATDIKVLSRKGWLRFSKPVDPGFDTWSHNLGGPDQSYVNSDKVAGPWSEVRWIGDPRWGALRMSYPARVTAGGRVYYNENRMAPDGSTLTWLVARDAWNGFELWRTPIGSPPKYGTIGATLTCDENQVYCVESNKTLVARDGRSGRKVLEYAPGFKPTVVTAVDSVLLVCDLRISPRVASHVTALDKKSGKIVWTRPGITHAPAENGTAFVLGGGDMEAVNLASGASTWKTRAVMTNGYANVFCKAGVVYSTFAAPWKPISILTAYDARSGALLWKQDAPKCSYGIYPYANELWLMQGGAKSCREIQVFDPRTGSKKRDLFIKGPVNGHCFPGKGAGNYLLFSNSWHLNLKTGEASSPATVRSPCDIGQMPANGMSYFFPHHCDCGVTLRGVLAMSGPGRRTWIPNGATNYMPRVVSSGSAPASPAVEKPDDWPMYRKDTARSNFSPGKLPNPLKPLWSQKLGHSRLSQAVSAGAVVYTTEPKSHRLFARDTATGKERWSFIADGRTDYPPALHKGLCLFSTAAGSVYALDAGTGKEVWRMRAAPAEKYIAEEGQFASAWPVVGGVMPMNGNIFFTCGRSAGVDGGMWLLAADAASGKVRWRVKGGSSGDMFLSDGTKLMLTKIYYNAANGARLGGGKQPSGLLRTTAYLTYVSVLDYMACVEPNLAHQKHVELTDGRITGENLAFSDKMGVAAWRYRFGVPKEMMKKNKADQRFLYARVDGKNTWLLDDNIRQQMMGVILVGDNAYMAGIPTPPDPNAKSELWVLAGADGKKLQVLPLDAQPVYDGLSAAGGRLYMATEDGRLTCFGSR